MIILYISQNGITEHIGRSQIAPYLIELAKKGFKIHVLSAEKKDCNHLVSEYRRRFSELGIAWSYIRYHNNPPLISTLFDLIRMYLIARRIILNSDINLVHCRSFLPAMIGFYLKKEFGIRYIFDFRDFWADGGMQVHRFKFVYRYFKFRERDLITSADKIVCLTNRAEDVLTNWYFKHLSHANERFQVIPCCADFSFFDTSLLSPDQISAARLKANVSTCDYILLYLGSLGPDYLLNEMIVLFRQVSNLKQNAVFLFICNSGWEIVKEACQNQGVDLNNIRFISAQREEIPALISLANISVVFIRAGTSKVGCSPIKLAELFACNVPVIANTGVGDLDSIIDLAKNGSVIVDDFSETTLYSAVECIINNQANQSVSFRENSREFALEEGVARYAAVYQELLDKPATLSM